MPCAGGPLLNLPLCPRVAYTPRVCPQASLNPWIDDVDDILGEVLGALTPLALLAALSAHLDSSSSFFTLFVLCYLPSAEAFHFSCIFTDAR